MSSFTEFLGLVFWTAWIMLEMSWFIVLPIMAVSFYTGLRMKRGAVWILIALFIGAFILIPLTGERGSGAMVYLGLPFVLPIYILPLFAIGQLFARRKPKQIDKDIIEVR